MVGCTLMPSSVLDGAGGDLVLRVCGPSRAGQILRLKSPKCTIGAGERCTLRLRARGLRPVHCLILRGPGGTVIRRWSADTRLNGHAFTDAALQTGDHIDVGAIGLEVLQTAGVSAVRPSGPPPTSPAQPAGMTPADRRRLTNLSARLQLANRQGRQRVRRLLEQLRSCRPALDEARQALAQRQAERHAGQVEAEAELGERAKQLDTLAAQLASQRTTLEQDQGQWDRQRAQTQQQLAQRANELDTLAAQLASQRTTLEQDQGQWDRQRAQTQQQLAQRADELDALQAELTARQEALDRRARQAESDRAGDELACEEAAADAAPQEPEYRAVDQAAPVDMAAVFRKLGASGVLRDEEPDDDPPTPQPQPQETPSAAQSPGSLGPAEQAHDGDEESIDDYMSRLMDRVRGGAGSEESSAAGRQSTPRRQPEGPAPQVDEEPVQPPDCLPKVAPRRKPAEIAARVIAPERAGGLAAMRELANISAQSALERHARGQMTRTIRAKLAVAVGALAAGGLLLWMWQRGGTAGPVVFYAALVGLLAAVLWGIEYALLTRHMIFGKAGRFSWLRAGRGDSKQSPAKGGPKDTAKQQPAAAGGNEPAAVPADRKQGDECPQQHQLP